MCLVFSGFRVGFVLFVMGLFYIGYWFVGLGLLFIVALLCVWFECCLAVVYLFGCGF